MIERSLTYPMDAAVHLLERRLPGWRLEFVTGEAPPPYVTEWTSAPSLPQVAEYGRFPGTFAGPDGARHPVRVEHIDIEDEDAEETFGAYRAASGFPDTNAERAVDLVTTLLNPQNHRTRTLARYIAGTLAEGGEDLLVIETAAQPGGPPLPGELHLLVRDGGGRTARLSVAPAHLAGALPDDDPHDRVTCATTLLSECLWVNNNNQVDFEVTFGTHNVDLTGPAPEKAFTEGWEGAGDWEIHEDDLRPLDDPRSALSESERNMSDFAYGSAMYGETAPETPGDNLVAWLGRELLTAVTAALGAPPLLTYGSGVPLGFDGEGACLLLVTPDRFAMIEVDDGC